MIDSDAEDGQEPENYPQISHFKESYESITLH